MLIGIDHITLACSNVEKFCSIFLNNGYSKHIEVKNIPNLHIKKEFLQAYNEKQSFTIVKKTGSFNIEIIHDSNKLTGNSIYTPIFRENNFSGITVNVYDKQAFIKQWSSIGFKNIDGNLLFTTFGNSYIIRPVEKEKKKYYLDNKGFVCLAFITTSILDDYDNMKKNSFYVSSIDNIQINNKNLQVFFAKGSNGELIEIIGLKHDSRN